MTRIDCKNSTILLNNFTPCVRFLGKSNIQLNNHDLPKNKDIWKIIYKELDQGFMYVCKKFEIKELNNDINNVILDFLPKSRINIRDVKLFWNDIFIQRLMNMNDLIVKQTLIYNTIFINDEQLQNIRLYNIECKIKELKSLRYEKN
tara:strand:+ start:1925 stop:2365 length:441 start_codon:yes stop_codon:yes gene_type:complete